MDRRKFLAVAGATSLSIAGGLSGCSTLSGDSPGERSRFETGTSGMNSPTATEPPCENGGELVTGWVVADDDLGGFDLSASKDSITRGDRITFRLENVTDTEQLSGNSSKYSIHYETEEGWRDIFYRAPTSERPAYHDDAVPHPPGEGFTWEIAFDESGLAHDIENGLGSLVACTPLRPGTYRFVYRGVTTEQETSGDSEKEYALGVRFKVVDE